MAAGANGVGAWLRRRLGAPLLAALALGVDCSPSSTGPVARRASLAPGGAPTAVAATALGPGGAAAPRFILLFIGDGMGPAQVVAAERYRAAADPAARAAGSALGFIGFRVQTSVSTHSADAAVTDSAAAGTALATGRKTNNGFLGLASDGITSLESVAAVAHRRGLRVGLVSSVPLDHATPAAFYAHRAGRGDLAGIAADLVASDYDYFGGGGLLGGGAASSGAATVWAALAARGTTLARGPGWRHVRRLPLFATALEGDDPAAMPYELDRAPTAPRLADFTRQAIELFGTDRGFFLLVEGGRIDWACHAGDLAAAATETLEFGAAVGVGIEFASRHVGEALLVVTADHETGGLVLGVPPSGGGFAALRRQTMSHAALAAAIGNALSARPDAPLAGLSPLLERALGEPIEGEVAAELGAALAAGRRQFAAGGGATAGPDAAGPLVAAALGRLARRAGAQWSTTDHTATPVRVYAEGAAAERFAGLDDNAEVGRTLVDLVVGVTAEGRRP